MIEMVVKIVTMMIIKTTMILILILYSCIDDISSSTVLHLKGYPATFS